MRNNCSEVGGELAGNSKSQAERTPDTKTVLGSNVASSTPRLCYHSRQVVSSTW